MSQEGYYLKERVLQGNLHSGHSPSARSAVAVHHSTSMDAKLCVTAFGARGEKLALGSKDFVGSDRSFSASRLIQAQKPVPLYSFS